MRQLFGVLEPLRMAASEGMNSKATLILSSAIPFCPNELRLVQIWKNYISIVRKQSKVDTP